MMRKENALLPMQSQNFCAIRFEDSVLVLLAGNAQGNYSHES